MSEATALPTVPQQQPCVHMTCLQLTILFIFLFKKREIEINDDSNNRNYDKAD